MARDSLRISAAQRQRLRNLLRRARETSGGIRNRNRDLAGANGEWRIANRETSIRYSLFASLAPVSVSVSVAVFGVLADVLDGHHVLVFGGVEHDDTLGRAAGNPDTLDRTADQLTLVGHQHDLVAVLDRERRHQLAVAAVHRHRDDALAAAPGGPVFERRRALAIAVFADGQHELLMCGHFDIALLAEFDGAGGVLAVGSRLLFDAA